MIIAGQLLLDDGSGRCRLAPGFVRTHDELIDEVVIGEIPDAADLGGRSTLISPGFIDAHLHLPQFGSIGAHGLPLLKWLEQVVYVAEQRWADTDLARAMTRRVAQQLLSVGTTGIGAYATVHHDATRAALEEIDAVGLRGVIGQVLMDRGAPSSLCREAAQLIDQSAQLAESYPAGRRLATAVTPRFAVSCSESLLAAAGQLASSTGLMIQTHLAETTAEIELVKQRFGELSYVGVYARAGLLTFRSIFGHGVHLDQPQRDQLRTAGAVIAHCPTANRFLRSGTMNRAQMIADGIGVVLGSDIGAGYDRSMVRVARAAIEAAASIGESFPDAASQWHAITAGAAAILGWDDGGRIERGCVADLLVIQPDVAWLECEYDPLARLLYTWDDRWLKQTILRGQIAWPNELD